MSLFISPTNRATDSNGDPISGAKWYFYITGTTTPIAVYTTGSLSVAHANPVVANGFGLFPPIYLDPDITYRAVQTNAAGATIQDIDPYYSTDTALDAGLAAEIAARIAGDEALQDALNTIGLGTMIDVMYATKAALDADLAHDADSIGLVHSDPSEANNDLYIKVGASGAGSWTNTGALHAIIEGLAQPYVDAAAAIATSLATFDRNLADLVSYVTVNGLEGGVYDPSVLGTVWQDSAGTTPATAPGDPVKRIDSLAGGWHLTGSSGTDVELAIDETGRHYLDVPAGAALWSSQDKTFGPYCYLAWAGVDAAEIESSLFAFADGSTEGMAIKRVGNISTKQQSLQVQLEQTGNAFYFMVTRPSTHPNTVPGFMDALMAPASLSIWDNGASRAFPALGSPQAITTDRLISDTIPTCRIGINHSGASVINHAQKFYGGVVIPAIVPTSLRAQISEWLRSRTGMADPLAQFHDVFASFGQSNQVGKGDHATATLVPRGQGSHWIDTGYVRPMADGTQHFRNSYSLSGSAWPAFCKEWYDLRFNPALIVGAAADSCGLQVSGADGNWGPSSDLTELACQKILDCLQYLGSHTPGYRMRGVIYGGGEQDAPSYNSGPGLDMSVYIALLVGLRDRIRVHLDEPDLPLLLWSLDRQSISTNDVGYANIRQAFIDAAAANDGIELIMPYQDFAGSGGLEDVTHLNQASLNTAGEIMATNADAVLDD